MEIVLVHPEIPQNTGNVARTCVAINAKLWLVRPLGFQLSDHHLKRAGLDYWQYLEWEVVSSWDELTSRLAEQFRMLRAGPAEFDLDCGPVINAKQQQRIEGYLDRALDRDVLEVTSMVEEDLSRDQVVGMLISSTH